MGRLSIVELGKHALDNRTELPKVNRHDVPEPTVIEMLIVVPQDVANADDRAPGHFRCLITQGGWQALAASEMICNARSVVRRRA